MGSKALSSRQPTAGYEWVDSGAMKGFRAASLSFIDRVYGSDHPHFKEFHDNTSGCTPRAAEQGIAILDAIRSEIDGGWLFTVRGLITAEVFADFVEMAEHLLEAGYKDAAAVMCGSVLEEHLRQLCTKNGISTHVDKDDKQIPKKADRLNSELAKNEVYSKLDQKMVTAWLDLRNKAAHGQYSEYTDDQVKNMLFAVTEFMARVAV
ncbi:MAG: hypothetical protein CEE38_00715 [Planctomycetes bacterium B3_Pla]|nr:MAG: hypothetical protein CEE38_00715 [Planctomycetes bacterium B3_Pla]